MDERVESRRHITGRVDQSDWDRLLAVEHRTKAPRAELIRRVFKAGLDHMDVADLLPVVWIGRSGPSLDTHVIVPGLAAWSSLCGTPVDQHVIRMGLTVDEAAAQVSCPGCRSRLAAQQ